MTNEREQEFHDAEPKLVVNVFSTPQTDTLFRCQIEASKSLSPFQSLAALVAAMRACTAATEHVINVLGLDEETTRRLVGNMLKDAKIY